MAELVGLKRIGSYSAKAPTQKGKRIQTGACTWGKSKGCAKTNRDREQMPMLLKSLENSLYLRKATEKSQAEIG
jgi:hypothetical protein